MIKLIIIVGILFHSQTYAANIFQLPQQSANTNLADIEPNHQPWEAGSIYVAG
ncbi:chitodextrinase, partial [Pseudoalteromonas sp. S558]